MRLTIDEYSQHFKMSKEMVNSKLRSKRLNYIIENGNTYIIVTKHSLNNDAPNTIKQENIKKESVTVPQSKQRTTVAMVISLYQKENQQLKEKIIQLEEKVDKLIDDKEQMLRDEMKKIEHVYSEKDKQLKNILELINAQMLMQKDNTIHEVETIEKKDSVLPKQTKEVIELKEYLKLLNLKSHQKKVIKKRFLAVYDKDVRIIKKNGNLLLDFSKYDYSDLLDY